MKKLLKIGSDLFTNNNAHWDQAKLTLHPKRPYISDIYKRTALYRILAGFERDGHSSRRTQVLPSVRFGLDLSEDVRSARVVVRYDA